MELYLHKPRSNRFLAPRQYSDSGPDRKNRELFGLDEQLCGFPFIEGFKVVEGNRGRLPTIKGAVQTHRMGFYEHLLSIWNTTTATNATSKLDLAAYALTGSGIQIFARHSARSICKWPLLNNLRQHPCTLFILVDLLSFDRNKIVDIGGWPQKM